MSTFYIKLISSTGIFCHTTRNLIITCVIAILIAITLQPDHSVAIAEYFSSVDSLQKLTDVEMELIQTFRNYIEMQNKELYKYRRFIEQVKLQHSIATEGTADYLSNPINAFTLIKRMVTDWTNLHDFIKESQARNAFHETLDKINQEQKIPDHSELTGAVMGLVRLQKVYNLSAYDLADGQINNVYTGTELSWNDCFEIASDLFDRKEFSLALTWFEVVLEKLDEIEGNDNDAVDHRFEIEALEYLALCNYELGNSEKAVEYIDEILILSPNHHTKEMLLYIMNSPPKSPPALTDYYSARPNYTRLCQGIQIPQKELQSLKCTVETRENPYFVLAPLKIEQLSRDPEITVYHGLLTDVQIDQIIDEAEDNMFRSEVGGGSSSTVSDVRVSQQAWLQYISPVMRSIKNLVGQITGFDMVKAEEMQMANYGIGGQYDPHHDFFGPSYYDYRYPGDRIATNMFYLSEVKQGGYTAFPHINVYARPVKGSMVSWCNLHKSLDPDYRTLHAGCPVVIGSKRIGNVWIHSSFQELRRPCGLENDTYKSQLYK